MENFKEGFGFALGFWFSTAAVAFIGLITDEYLKNNNENYRKWRGGESCEEK